MKVNKTNTKNMYWIVTENKKILATKNLVPGIMYIFRPKSASGLDILYIFDNLGG